MVLAAYRTLGTFAYSLYLPCIYKLLLFCLHPLHSLILLSLLPIPCLCSYTLFLPSFFPLYTPSSTSGLLLCSLLLAALLNSWTDSHMIFPPCSTLLSLAALTNPSSSSQKFLFNSNKNSSTDIDYIFSASIFSKTLSFYTSANPLLSEHEVSKHSVRSVLLHPLQ